MTIARRLIVDRTVSSLYHCVNRCVRRAFLCGDDHDYRKDWIRDRLRELADAFAIDVAAYAILSNHLHVVVRTDPERAVAWTDLEVVERWSRLFPASVRTWAAKASRSPDPPDDDGAIGIVAADRDRVRLLRDRLADLSWFMKCLKEPIARRANREDGCTGCFWEGRFKSPRLLDDTATLAGMVYVDLNLVRAGLAPTPEQSDHTSVQDRIHVRQLFEKRKRRRKRPPARARSFVTGVTTLRSAEDGIWLAPIAEAGDGSRSGVLPLSLDDYLTIVDATGRLIRSGKRGFIPPQLPPILERLKLDASRWSAAWHGLGRVLGTAVGSSESRAAEARRRGRGGATGMLARLCPA